MALVYSSLSGDNPISDACRGSVVDGRVYRSPFFHEMTACVGKVDEQGLIYNSGWNSAPFSRCVGSVDAKGYIYNKPYFRQLSSCVGKVDSSGFVYDRYSAVPGSYVHCVGRVLGGTVFERGAAALLLLLRK